MNATNATKALVFAGVCCMVGCASIVSKSKYDVSVSSNVDGAMVSILDRDGREVNKVTTPSTVTLSAKSGFFSRAEYRFDFQKQGYQKTSETTSAKLNEWYFGNILFGGLLGLLIVDPATGAMWKMDDQVSAVLVKEPNSVEESSKLVEKKTVKTLGPGVGLALLVGVNDYDLMGKLDNCRQDATEMRNALVGAGGYSSDRVVLLTDDAVGVENKPSFANLTRRIEQSCKLARPEDVLLIYFAGHGITEGGTSYLVPQDGGETMTCIQLSWVQNKMKESPAKHKVLIVDACHSGKTTRGISGIVPSVGDDSGCVMISSCAENELSYPEGKHGAFTQCLLEGIQGDADLDANGQISNKELFGFVQERMEKWCLKTGKTQRPQMLPQNAKDVDIARVSK